MALSSFNTFSVRESRTLLAVTHFHDFPIIITDSDLGTLDLGESAKLMNKVVSNKQ